MGEAARHIHHQPVLGGQRLAEPAAIRRRIRSQIEDRVPQRASDAAHKLDLGSLADLIMQAAQRAGGGGQRIVDVDEARLQPLRREFPLAEHAREEASGIAALLQFDQPRAGERGLMEDHVS